MYGIGIDVCEVKRFDRLQQNDAFLKRVFTEEEQAYCRKRKTSSQAFAARFAAKEAFSKAIGTGIKDGICLVDIEIRREESGKPYLSLSGGAKEWTERNNITKIHLSLTHERNVAVAVVILE